MRRRIAFALLVVLCIFVPASASEKLVFGKDAIRVGIVFTSDNFNVPDDLAKMVTGILGSALDKTHTIKVVSFSQMNDARKTLGFSSAGFADMRSLSEIGKKANVHFAVQTKIIYDLEKAAKNEGLLGLGKLFKVDASAFVKREKPKFKLSVVDCISSSLVFDYDLKLNLFSAQMKEQLLAGFLKDRPSLGFGSMDFSLLNELAVKLAPILEQIITEAALLKIQKETKDYGGMADTAIDIVSGKKHSGKDVENAVVKAANNEIEEKKTSLKRKASNKKKVVQNKVNNAKKNITKKRKKK